MRRRQLISLLGEAALAPLTALSVYLGWPERVRPRAGPGPPDGCGGSGRARRRLAVASVDEDKLIDRGALCGMADRLAASSTANVHAVLVARGGKLVFERYFRGSTRFMAAGWETSPLMPIH